MSSAKTITFPLHGGQTWSATWSDENNAWAPTLIDIVELGIDHIAHGLSLVNRFCGQTPQPYSVGRHSIILARQAKRAGWSDEFCRYCLLHDCPEALGAADAHGALKKLLCPNVRAFEASLMRCVWMKLEGGKLSDSFVQIGKEMDQTLGNYEAYQFGFPHAAAPAKGWPPYSWVPYAYDTKDVFLSDWASYGGKI